MKKLAFYAFVLASIPFSSVEAVDWMELCKENVVCGTAQVIAECKDDQGCYENKYKAVVKSGEDGGKKVEKCVVNIFKGKFKC